MSGRLMAIRVEIPRLTLPPSRPSAILLSTFAFVSHSVPLDCV